MTDKAKSSIEDDIRYSEDKPSDFSKVTELLLNDNYKRRKTILHNRLIVKITSLDVISQLYDIPFLQNWIQYFAEWRTSGDGGKGRQDIVDISKFHYAQMKEQRQELMQLLGNRQ